MRVTLGAACWYPEFMSLNTPNTSTANESGHPHLIEWFRQATPYINAHRGKTFVIMLSGDAVASDNIHNTIHDIVLLNSLGIRIVIVHGIRNQLSQQLDERGIQSQIVKGLRVTDRAILDCAIQASSLVRSRLETKLSMGLPNSPMHGAKVCVASANVITAKPAGIVEGVDLQQTGVVRKIDGEAIERLLDMNNVVLLSPIGHSPAGEAFSLGHQQVAAEIAITLQAEKLIAFTDSDGLHNDADELLREVNTEQALAACDNLTADSETSSAVKALVHALDHSVGRAHLMNFNCDGALLEELFTVDGAGTLIQKSHFETLRLATQDDIPAIIDIIRPLEKQGVLVRRDRDKLEAEIDHFTVIEREGLIVGVAALYPFASEKLGEIACITTHPEYRNSNRGATLLKALESVAKEKGLNAVFVLTTQTEHWFLENGFKLASVEDLPAQKQSLYNFQRNSKVLVKSL